MLEQLGTWVAAGFAAISGVLWVIAARAEVPAPPNTSGVGAPFGGYLISRNANGERIDLHETYKKQSYWNSHAAYGSALAAMFTALALIAHAKKL